MTHVLNRLIDVPSSDPEDARRRKLLNILLLGVMGLTLITLLLTVVATLLGQAGQSWEGAVLIAACLIMLAGVGVIYGINLYRSGWIASALFLLLLVVVFAFSDQPRELASGRSTFLFAIPIIIGSVLIRPYTSFVLAGLAGIVLTLLALNVEIVPDIPAILGFFVIALVSWLSARSLERALRELQATNQELDQRVNERTRDLQQALQHVQEESSKNQAILESIADGVVVFDNDAKAIVANPAMGEFIGRPVELIAGAHITALMGDHVSQVERERLVQSLSDQSLVHTGTRIQWGRKTLSVSLAAVRDAGGSKFGDVIVFRDFTREAELERMKSAFVSTASHELRTPLNAILGYSDMLKEAVYGAISTEQTEVVSRIIANTRRMLGLVNNILDQAQIEAGQLKITPSEFVVQQLVDDLKSVMWILAEQKKLQFEIAVAPDLPTHLWSDAQRLHQILVNLVGNAIKFTEQGKVSVALSRPTSSQWMIQVSDSGAGIPEEAQAYIFEPFRQVDDTVTRRYPGTGLGLAIVKELITLLGGEISVSSKMGEGSTFIITLPLRTAQGEAA